MYWPSERTARPYKFTGLAPFPRARAKVRTCASAGESVHVSLSLDAVWRCQPRGVAPQLRKAMGLPSLKPSKHEHPLEERSSEGGWGCDGCNCSGSQAAKRYRCEDCDFDFCDKCYALQQEEQEVLPAKLQLIDIPSDSAFYDGPGGEITVAVLEKFLSDYKAGSLERKQLS